MHPGSPENRIRLSAMESAKAGLTPEQRSNLVELEQELTSLWSSLTDKNVENSIRYIYGRILDEQTGQVKNPILMNQLKLDLMTAYNRHHDHLNEILRGPLPEGLVTYFHIERINLPKVAENMRNDIVGLMTQDLNKEVETNKFRLSTWLEKVQKILFAIKKLL